MHIEYWKCDECNKIIDYDEQTKYTTPEMGIPYVPKNGGGKHFHRACLIKFYNAKKDLTKEQRIEYIEDAIRRHSTQVARKVKKGTLTNEKLATRKSTKKDREALINYFYDYYGMRAPTQKLNSIIDSLNEGKDFKDYKGIQITYPQMKDMLVYYRKELDNSFANVRKKGGTDNPLSRIYYDIAIIINNLGDYTQRKGVLYNEVTHNRVDGGETLEDYSAHFKYKPKKSNKDDFDKMEDINELSSILGEIDD